MYQLSASWLSFARRWLSFARRWLSSARQTPEMTPPAVYHSVAASGRLVIASSRHFWRRRSRPTSKGFGADAAVDLDRRSSSVHALAEARNRRPVEETRCQP